MKSEVDFTVVLSQSECPPPFEKRTNVDIPRMVSLYSSLSGTTWSVPPNYFLFLNKETEENGSEGRQPTLIICLITVNFGFIVTGQVVTHFLLRGTFHCDWLFGAAHELTLTSTSRPHQ